METAIRWAPDPAGHQQHRFLLVDVVGHTITLNETRHGNDRDLHTRILARYDNIPAFHAFDWSKNDSSLVALGLSSGDASLVKIYPDDKVIKPLRIFPIKTQRKCNSVAFNPGSLLAVGLDRVRNDHCLTIHDVNEGKEPLTKLCTGEAVSSVRFFPRHPQELVAAVARTTLRLFDLRSPTLGALTPIPTVFTKQVNNIAIDPLDDNYFASAGLASDPSVSVWDKRWLTRANQTAESPNSQAVLDIRPAVDHVMTKTAIWSVRFSGRKRGRFCVLSSDQELKLYDVTTHTSKTRSSANYPFQTPQNTFSQTGSSPWSSATYVSRTHRLQNPYRDASLANNDIDPVLAFDWVGSGEANGQSLLTIWPSREVGVLYAPRASQALLTPRGDFSMLRPQGVLDMLEPNSTSEPVSTTAPRQPPDAKEDATLHHSKAPSFESAKSRATDNGLEKTRGTLHGQSIAAKRTDEWLHGDDHPSRPVITDMKSIGEILSENSIHGERCREGYRLDPVVNARLVRDDPRLSRLWAIIGRLEDFAKDNSMTTEVLDMSYLGVHSLWHGMESETRNRVMTGSLTPAVFQKAIKTIVYRHALPEDLLPRNASMNKRLLCLEMCGWCFTREGLEAKCSDLLNQGRYYRAVAVAVWQGHNDLALLILRNLARTKVSPDTGLGALLAAQNLNEVQRDMAIWMEDDATDPYLKSLLRHICLGDWKIVVEDTSLALSDRISVALRYFDEAELDNLINETTATCVQEGDINGIFLTGLTSTSMDLFQNFILQTNDIQTAVLASAFTNPLYVDDVRFNLWKDSYLWHMQTWNALIERTKFTMEHSRRAVTRSGERLIKPRPRQITLRCVHCNSSVAEPLQRDNGPKDSKKKPSTQPNGKGAIRSSGTVCARCGRHLPRCVICMRWLGTPDVGPFSSVEQPPVLSALPKAKNKDEDRERDFGSEAAGALQHFAAKTTKKDEPELLSRFVTFCANCGHGFHAHHASQWFAKHGMCPVPDCQCLCGLRA